jgi:hypothetical protein
VNLYFILFGKNEMQKEFFWCRKKWSGQSFFISLSVHQINYCAVRAGKFQPSSAMTRLITRNLPLIILYGIILLTAKVMFGCSVFSTIIASFVIYGSFALLIKWGQHLVESDPNRDIIEGLKQFDERKNM